MTRIQHMRGFNLLAMFNADRRRAFETEEMELIASWGFDFLRFPLDYRSWANPSDPSDPARIDRRVLDELLRAVGEANSLGLHVCLNFHRAPGYCVNQPPEPRSLWDDAEALAACALHWRTFAETFKGFGPEKVSFNLLNEPGNVDGKAHEKVVRRLIEEIRSVDPDRLIVVDGGRWGREPWPELTDLDVVQSTRGYDPMWLSHYRASWIKGSENYPAPGWPGKGPDGRAWDADALREKYRPWRELGAEVHCGEMGVYSKTPHEVALAWLGDSLSFLSECGFGWALWNLRGAFGVLDSGRDDVEYERTAHGLLDRHMLELLRQHLAV